LWIAAIAIVAAISGCGGSDSSSGSSGSLSKEEFVTQANAICAEGKKKGLAAMSVYVKHHEAAGQANKAKLTLIAEAIKAVLLPSVQTQVDEIRALGTPEGDEKQVAAFLAATEDAIESSSKRPASAGPNFGPNFKRSAELGHEYGLNGCAYG
jgi:hypothetical protein